MIIPASAHFIWFGAHLPYAYILVHAQQRFGGLVVIIHHADDLEMTPELQAAMALPGLD